MSLHNEIMNLPTGKDCPEDAPARLLYKQGHRDARHAAAELSIKADQLMEEMAEALDFYAENDDAFDVASSALEKYNAYKERAK